MNRKNLTIRLSDDERARLDVLREQGESEAAVIRRLIAPPPPALPVRPRVLLDVDGVLADFVGHACSFLPQIGAPALDPADVRSYDLRESVQKRYHRRMEDSWRKDGFCLSMPVLPGAKEGVRRLWEVADVVFVTAPMRAHLTWCSERTHWILHHFPQAQFEDVIFAHKKELVKGDLFIDDRPENVRAWLASHPNGLGVLWTQPYNQEARVPGACYTNSWAEVLGWIGGET